NSRPRNCLTKDRSENTSAFSAAVPNQVSAFLFSQALRLYRRDMEKQTTSAAYFAYRTYVANPDRTKVTDL
ncbi:MAG: hypothetical protein ACRYG8_14060, partial [Janthinobacterium lividum]